MKFFLTLLTVVLFQTLFANTYYISPAGSDGNGNGTASSPWKTLFKATLSAARPGDIIHVFPGVYIENIKSSLAVGVSIEGEGANCIIQSTLTQQFVPIILAQSPEGTNGNQSISFLKFDGNKQSTSWAIGIGGRSNVVIHDCIFMDFDESGVSFSGINALLTPGAPAIYATGNKFYNNTLTNCAKNDGYGRGGLQFGGQEGMLIYNNVLTQSGRGFAKNGWPLKMANEGYIRGCKIYNNKIIKQPYLGNTGGEDGWNFAMEFWNVEGLEIYGNTIQGALDIANCSKGNYEYGLYVHNNTFSQQASPLKYEDGIILETNESDVWIKNNSFKNITTGIVFSPHDYGGGSGVDVHRIVIDSNVFENLGIRGGGQGMGIRWNNTDFNPSTYVSDITVSNNKFIAVTGANAAVIGVHLPGYQGPVISRNIKIINNLIQGFQYAPIAANPASGVDSLWIENNRFYGNGNNNEPLYTSGVPTNIIQKNNKKGYSATAPKPGFNFKQQILKPVYYDLKRTTLLEYIAVLAGILSVWFSRKENIYVYPVGLLNTIIYIFLSFDQGLFGEASVNFYYTVMSIYGWMMWSKRDRRHHRVVRITGATKKEWLTHIAFFAFFFITIFFSLTYLKRNFAPGAIPWADAFASATAFTGMWLMTKKKVESWYWWIATNIASIPLYFVKHFVLTSFYYCILLVMAFMGLQEWQKRKLKLRTSLNR